MGKDIETRPMNTEGGEKGQGKKYEESNMEIYNTICKINHQWKFACDSGNSNRNSVTI